MPDKPYVAFYAQSGCFGEPFAKWEDPDKKCHRMDKTPPGPPPQSAASVYHNLSDHVIVFDSNKACEGDKQEIPPGECINLDKASYYFQCK